MAKTIFEKGPSWQARCGPRIQMSFLRTSRGPVRYRIEGAGLYLLRRQAEFLGQSNLVPENGIDGLRKWPALCSGDNGCRSSSAGCSRPRARRQARGLRRWLARGDWAAAS